jgi:hypothetical protein
MDHTSSNHNNDGNNNKHGGGYNKWRRFGRLVRVTRSRPDEATRRCVRVRHHYQP